MTNVYILTKEGRAYSTEGLEYLTKYIADNLNITDNLWFCQGTAYNEPENLIKALKREPTKSVIVLSTNKNIITIADADDIKNVMKILTDNSDKSCWETLTKTAYKQHNNN